MLVMMYGQVRVSYAMSRDGLLPKRLAKVHPKFKTPFLNTWTTGIIAALISGLIDLNVLAHLVNMGTLSAFALVAVAVIVMRRTHQTYQGHLRLRLYHFTSINSDLLFILNASIIGDNMD